MEKRDRDENLFEERSKQVFIFSPPQDIFSFWNWRFKQKYILMETFYFNKEKEKETKKIFLLFLWFYIFYFSFWISIYRFVLVFDSLICFQESFASLRESNTAYQFGGPTKQTLREVKLLLVGPPIGIQYQRNKVQQYPFRRALWWNDNGDRCALTSSVERCCRR